MLTLTALVVTLQQNCICIFCIWASGACACGLSIHFHLLCKNCVAKCHCTCHTRSGRRTQEDFKPPDTRQARLFPRFCTHRADRTARTQCFLSTSSSASHFLVRNGRFRLIISPAKNVVSVGYSCGTEELKEAGELMSEWQRKVARVKRWLKAVTRTFCKLEVGSTRTCQEKLLQQTRFQLLRSNWGPSLQCERQTDLQLLVFHSTLAEFKVHF